MKRLVCIGEGHGEAEALPRLCHSIREYLGITSWIVDKDIVRRPRSDFVSPSLGRRRSTECNARGLSRAIELARRRPADGILVLCDADDDCAASWAASVKSIHLQHVTVVSVMAVREYEAWLLWNIDEAVLKENQLVDPETKRDAKGGLRRIIPGYAPTTHQLELTRKLDVSWVRARSRSFDKLVRELAILFGVEAPPRPSIERHRSLRRRRRTPSTK